jgi:tripartite ATP-independent transporter DctP family solute receptor
LRWRAPTSRAPPSASHYGQGAGAFAAAVGANPVLAEIVRIDVHGNAELGDELSMLKDCADGTLDLMVCSGAALSNVVKPIGLLNALFLFRDVERARATLDGPVGAQLAALMAAHDLHWLAWGENGLRHITANRPVRRPADLAGIKIRVPQSEVMLAGFRALGADAGPYNFNQLREALRTGQFQAQENPIGTIETARLYEMQSTLSLTGHVYDAAAFLASADVAEDLTPPQMAALAACAARGATVTRAVAAAAQQSGVQRLASAGMTVVSDVDVAAFRAAARPFLDSLRAVYGAELMQQVANAAA